MSHRDIIFLFSIFWRGKCWIGLGICSGVWYGVLGVRGCWFARGVRVRKSGWRTLFRVLLLPRFIFVQTVITPGTL